MARKKRQPRTKSGRFKDMKPPISFTSNADEVAQTGGGLVQATSSRRWRRPPSKRPPS